MATGSGSVSGFGASKKIQRITLGGRSLLPSCRKVLSYCCRKSGRSWPRIGNTSLGSPDGPTRSIMIPTKFAFSVYTFIPCKCRHHPLSTLALRRTFAVRVSQNDQAWNTPGNHPRIVKTMLKIKSLPQPVRANAASGGKMIAKKARQQPPCRVCISRGTDGELVKGRKTCHKAHFEYAFYRFRSAPDLLCSRE